MAIVSLGDQRVSIYDADGKVLEAPVSTGSTGYETPAGIFTLVQKKEEHRSNLYEDGEMPFMQRITWTGIALHAGNLPGHPASHGCVRLPMAFARQLFDMTELGMRVLIVRDDMRPSDISHPALFKPKPVPRELALAPPKGARVASVAADGEIVAGLGPAPAGPAVDRHCQGRRGGAGRQAAARGEGARQHGRRRRRRARRARCGRRRPISPGPKAR